MKVVIQDKGKLLGAHAVDNAKARIASAFSKFGQKVISVELLTDGITGDGRGAEVKSRLLVKLARMDDVATTVSECSLSKAISLSIGRAERAVARKLERRSYRKAERLRFMTAAV